MGILEVVLLIAGIVIFIGSFLLPWPEKKRGIDQRSSKRRDPRSDGRRNANSPQSDAG